jgi:hypothetical protein
VIPADNKWYARIASAAVIADVLIKIDPQYPQVSSEQKKELRQVRIDLQSEVSHRIKAA